jgi:cell division protease FtsH
VDDGEIDGATATTSASVIPASTITENPHKRRKASPTKAANVEHADADADARNHSSAASSSAPETDAERERRVLRLLARAASSMTGADVERVVREERQRCRRAGTAMAFGPLRAALRDGQADMPAELRRQVAIHEAGHAIVLRALALGGQGEMTIDGPEGGVTMTEIDPMTIQSEDRLMDLLAMKLAGSGAGEGTDLQAATALALDLECRTGFNADAPLLHIEPGNSSMIHLARPDAYRKANARLERAYEAARQLIERHRDAHGALVDALIVHGTLDGGEVDAILDVWMRKTE